MGFSTHRKSQVLRVPATTFVITHSPSRFNRRDSVCVSREYWLEGLETIALAVLGMTAHLAAA
jgi:hypothetical protein